MHRSTRIRSWIVALLCSLAVTLPATGCIGKRRPAAERDTAGKEASSGLVRMEDVDDRLSKLIDGERVRVIYDETDPYKGADVPLVTIVEFSDFQCPYCSRLAASLEQVLDGHAEDVRLVFKQFPLPMHADAEPGARAALAAHAQGEFWRMHDKLFANSRRMSRDDLMGYAKDLGLDMEKFEADFDGDALKEKVAGDMSQGRSIEVSSTPSFFVNGRLIQGARPVEQIEKIVEEERTKALELIEAGSKREEVYARILRAAAGGEADDEAPQPDPDHRRGEPSKIPNYAVPIGEDSPTRGPAEALVTIIEFGAFDCEACKKSAPLLDKLHERHPDVRFAFRHFPSERGEPSAAAAVAAQRQGQFWEMRTELLTTDALSVGQALKSARELGLNTKRFLSDLRSQESRKQIDADRAMAEKFRGTTQAPFFFVNGRFVGPDDISLDRFERLIVEETEKAEKFRKSEDVAKVDLFESMRKTWRGYRIAEETAAGGAAIDGAPVDMATDGLPVLGDPSTAKVSIVECSDFDCPFCSRVTPTLEKIAETYGDDVAIYFRQFPLPMHQDAEPAHRAALAAHAQGKFWEMHDKLFADRSARSEDQLATLAREIGLDVDQWRKDFVAPATKQKLEADMEACRQAGVTGTPSFFVNGKTLRGAQPFERFAAIIDQALEEAEG